MNIFKKLFGIKPPKSEAELFADKRMWTGEAVEGQLYPLEFLEGRYEVLSKYGDPRRKWVWAEIRRTPVTKGVHSGKSKIEFWHEGSCLGWIEPRYSDKRRELVDTILQHDIQAATVGLSYHDGDAVAVIGKHRFEPQLRN